MRLDLPSDRPQLTTTARDGGVIHLSPIVESDRAVLEAAWEELSPESRYSRFGQALGKLSKAELDYLSSVDQRTHVAWGATLDGEVAGVGRFILTSDCADVAVTVLDAHQRRGVGTSLFFALAAVARHDDVPVLCFQARADNEAVLHIAKSIGIPFLTRDDTIEGRMSMSELPRSPIETEAVAVMSQARS